MVIGKFNRHSKRRNAFMLHGPLAHQGYDWWWHSFTAQDAETGEDKPFFVEFFICNPALAEKDPVFGQLPDNKKEGKKPSYLMDKAGTWGEDACQLHRFFSFFFLTFWDKESIIYVLIKRGISMKEIKSIVGFLPMLKQ